MKFRVQKPIKVFKSKRQPAELAKGETLIANSSKEHEIICYSRNL